MDVNIIGSPATNLVQSSSGAAAPPPTQTGIATPAPAPAPASTAAAGIGTSGAPAGTSQSTATAPPTLQQVKQAIDNINASLNGNGNVQGVQFAIDPNSKHIVVQVLDPETGKVIRQIPTEEIIQMGMDLGKKLGQVIQDQA